MYFVRLDSNSRCSCVDNLVRYDWMGGHTMHRGVHRVHNELHLVTLSKPVRLTPKFRTTGSLAGNERCLRRHYKMAEPMLEDLTIVTFFTNDLSLIHRYPIFLRSHTHPIFRSYSFNFIHSERGCWLIDSSCSS
jgi:hypothetical protein